MRLQKGHWTSRESSKYVETNWLNRAKEFHVFRLAHLSDNAPDYGAQTMKNVPAGNTGAWLPSLIPEDVRQMGTQQ